jgi:hypothetical protein
MDMEAKMEQMKKRQAKFDDKGRQQDDEDDDKPKEEEEEPYEDEEVPPTKGKGRGKTTSRAKAAATKPAATKAAGRGKSDTTSAAKKAPVSRRAKSNYALQLEPTDSTDDLVCPPHDVGERGPFCTSLTAKHPQGPVVGGTRKRTRDEPLDKPKPVVKQEKPIDLDDDDDAVPPPKQKRRMYIQDLAFVPQPRPGS